MLRFILSASETFPAVPQSSAHPGGCCSVWLLAYPMQHGHGLRGWSSKTTVAAFRHEPFPLEGNLFDPFLTPSLQLSLSYFPPGVFLLREQHPLLWSQHSIAGSSEAPRHQHKCIATCSLLVKELLKPDLQTGIDPAVCFHTPGLPRNNEHQPLSHHCIS